MLASFAAKTFAAWTFRLIWGVAGVIPTGWARQPLELFVMYKQDDLHITLQPNTITVLL